MSRDERPVSSTARWHRWKARQITGERIVPAAVSNDLVELMLESGAIDEEGSRNRKVLGKAIVAIVANALAHRGKKTR